MTAADDGVTYEAKALRTCDEDGSIHFSTLKKIAMSGTQYLYAVNNPIEPTRDMLIGTVTHFLCFGARQGAKPIVVYRGGVRRGEKWDAFVAENHEAEIVNPAEWEEGEKIAEALKASPLAQSRLAGARVEVPLVWEENGLKCSTSGVDIVCVSDDLGDLKTTATTHPETFQRQAFRMCYPQQLAFYRRGARANGMKTRGLFILGVERKGPYEVVDLDLTEAMIDFADKSVSLWLEKLRLYQASLPNPATVYDWPGYAASPIPWDLPAWMHDSEEEDEEAA